MSAKSLLRQVWMYPFFKKGYDRQLEIEDLHDAAKDDMSNLLGDTLEKLWNREISRADKNGTKPNLMKPLSKMFATEFIFLGILVLIANFLMRVARALVLGEYIKYFEKRGEYSKEFGWFLAATIIFIILIFITLVNFTTIRLLRIGMRCRIACCALVYRKILRMSKATVGKTISGQVLNLLCSDVGKFDNAFFYLNFIWMLPIVAIISTYVMYDIIGSSALFGLFVAALQAIPLQGYLARLRTKLSYKKAKRADSRVQTTSEIITGIQVIKMYAWENAFEKLIENLRRLETNFITKSAYIQGLIFSLQVFTERSSLFCTVTIYSLMGNHLTSDKIFPLLLMFNTVQLFMSILFPTGLGYYNECKVTIKRLEQFLQQDEIEIDSIDIKNVNKPVRIQISDGFASWDKTTNNLENINLDISQGTLWAIVGTVGAGKSTLLQVLLKELPLSSGKLKIDGNISYASQEPWLFLSSIRDNILFGLPYNKSKYKKVLNVCGLERDLDLFLHGDKTMVEERGMSLSGGQRARINLARAVYREADIYLLDDPLSAVDPHVAKQLFEQCVSGFLAGKTRILVTHQVQFLKYVHKIIVMNNGKIEKICAYGELKQNELSAFAQENEEINDYNFKDFAIRKHRLESVSSYTTQSSISMDDNEVNADEEEEKELLSKGAVPVSLYKTYFRAGSGWITLILMTVLLIVGQAASNGFDIYLAQWINSEEKCAQILNDTATNSSSLKNTNSNDCTGHERLYIAAGLISTAVILTVLGVCMFFRSCVKSSTFLHNEMFSRVLSTVMRFFDINSSGMILNRFSKDLGTIDEEMPAAMFQVIQTVLALGGIIVIVLTVLPWMTIVVFIFIFPVLILRNVFLTLAQNVKLLEANAKAPVLTHTLTTLNGIATIRASKAQKIVQDELDLLQDRHTGACFQYTVIKRMFASFLDVVTAAFIAILTFQFLIFDNDSIAITKVGLTLSQALLLTSILQMTLRQTAEVAGHMISTERIIEYTKLMKEETIPLIKPPKEWPQKGEIIFKKVFLKYVPGEPPVLSNLNFTITGGEKIGIVGRTGAGKSSIISALFRLTAIEGSIIIDNTDTSTINVQELRSRISIIPQVPMLFSETIRYNLDPFKKSDDAILWNAIEAVKLKGVINSLEQPVSEGGSNFSVGQKQLICLARAIIRRSKILVMDEATANIDNESDLLIQTTIREKFKDCTVLTIAHRLHTVADSDKIMVMDAGKLVEFDHPHILLQNPNSKFSRMVKETEKSMEANLREIAQNAYNSRFIRLDQ